MKEILILSGKGGSGKTSLCAAFAKLIKNAIFVDCDVDASDLPILLHPQYSERYEFKSGFEVDFELEKCISCGKCAELCKFNAIKMENNLPCKIAHSCEGCGVCADHCPAHAISLNARLCGYFITSTTIYGKMFHAQLLAGAENSGRLIAELRRNAQAEAAKEYKSYILSDGPPGIGCPVISASTGVDYAVIVTEPTLSGVHDMQRLATLLRQFEIPFSIIINKADLNGDVTQEIEHFGAKNGVEILGKIPFAPLFSEALRAGKTVLDYPDSDINKIVKDIWQKIENQGEKLC